MGQTRSRMAAEPHVSPTRFLVPVLVDCPRIPQLRHGLLAGDPAFDPFLKIPTFCCHPSTWSKPSAFLWIVQPGTWSSSPSSPLRSLSRTLQSPSPNGFPPPSRQGTAQASNNKDNSRRLKRGMRSAAGRSCWGGGGRRSCSPPASGVVLVLPDHHRRPGLCSATVRRRRSLAWCGRPCTSQPVTFGNIIGVGIVAVKRDAPWMRRRQRSQRYLAFHLGGGAKEYQVLGTQSPNERWSIDIAFQGNLPEKVRHLVHEAVLLQVVGQHMPVANSVLQCLASAAPAGPLEALDVPQPFRFAPLPDRSAPARSGRVSGPRCDR